MDPGATRRDLMVMVLGALTFVFMLLALVGALVWAPREATMGDVQRIFYFHMPSAWIALGPGFTVVFALSIAYLVTGRLKYDRVAAASAELGVVFTTITLTTGPIWAKSAWGVYWTWEPRLTTTLVLWFIYVGYLLLRSVAATAQTQVTVLGQNGQALEYHNNVVPKTTWRQEPGGLHISVVRAQRLYDDYKWPNPVVLKITNVKPAALPKPVPGGTRKGSPASGKGS